MCESNSCILDSYEKPHALKKKTLCIWNKNIRERHQTDEKMLPQKSLGKAGLNKSCAERYGASFSAAKGIQFVL